MYPPFICRMSFQNIAGLSSDLQVPFGQFQISRQALKTMLPISNTNGVCLYSHTLNSRYFNMYFPLVLWLTCGPHLCLTDSPLSTFHFLFFIFYFLFLFFSICLNNITSDYLSLLSTTIILILNYQYTVIQ